MTYRQWLADASAQLTQSESSRRDAEILLGFVTGKSRTFIFAFDETPISESQRQQLSALLARRKNGEPIAYLTGEREFWSLLLKVSPVTLIPRPDTERLVELALERIPAAGGKILDLGSGTGAIALALASERHDCQVTGVDYQLAAVELAQHNAVRLNINNAEFIQSDWYSSLSGQQFALIVSNPPYIDSQDPHLQQGDVRFEPESALIAGEQGLADIRYITEQSKTHLMPGGWLLFEHGWQQASAVRGIFQRNGFSHIATFNDYAGNERVTLGCYLRDNSDSEER